VVDVKMDDGSVTELGSRVYLESLVRNRHPATKHLIKLFAWSHLPGNLQRVSQPSGLLACEMVTVLSDSPELTTGLRKLLEAKDCFVRTALDKVEA
jgi:hypothetical protein